MSNGPHIQKDHRDLRSPNGKVPDVACERRPILLEMQLRPWLTGWLTCLLLCMCISITSVQGAKKKDQAPKTSVTYQDHSPSRVVYFDDSSVSSSLLTRMLK